MLSPFKEGLETRGWSEAKKDVAWKYPPMGENEKIYEWKMTHKVILTESMHVHVQTGRIEIADRHNEEDSTPPGTHYKGEMIQGRTYEAQYILKRSTAQASHPPHGKNPQS